MFSEKTINDHCNESLNFGQNHNADRNYSISTGKRVNQSRLEKKSRKALSKFDFKPIPGIVKIIIRKSKHVLFTITNPDVYKNPGSDTYAIFGDANIDDGSSSLNVDKPTQMPIHHTHNKSNSICNDVIVSSEDNEDNNKIDHNLTDVDINLVMTQVNCTKDMAIEALKKNNNDIVEAIISLSETE